MTRISKYKTKKKSEECVIARKEKAEPRWKCLSACVYVWGVYMCA